MKIGVFVPIGNNGWLISTHAPQYMPTFELNKAIVQKAEHYHFDFALSMIKLRGFGGKTEFWDHNLESFTLMAGLAAVTSRIQIYATAATLTLPPAIVARMAATIDSIRSLGDYRIVMAFQPHTYTRTKALFDDFVRELKKVDQVVLAEIYAARESNTIGISSADLAELIPGSVYCETLPEVTEWLRKNIQAGDVVLTVGAGDIYRAGEALLE